MLACPDKWRSGQKPSQRVAERRRNILSENNHRLQEEGGNRARISMVNLNAWDLTQNRTRYVKKKP